MPASNLCGSSPHVVFSTRTELIMWPPVRKGSIASSSSLRPQSAPTPLGPHILCAEIATKSAPSACTSTGTCGADWAASQTKIAPCSCAQAASFSTGLIVPSEFETWFVATTLTFPRAASPASAERSSSPSSVSGIIASVAPVRPPMYCQGTKFE